MADPTKEKICARCGVPKPLTAFGWHAKSRDGRRPSCRPCFKATKLGYGRLEDANADAERWVDEANPPEVPEA
jgi:hypothetical protein